MRQHCSLLSCLSNHRRHLQEVDIGPEELALADAVHRGDVGRHTPQMDSARPLGLRVEQRRLCHGGRQASQKLSHIQASSIQRKMSYCLRRKDILVELRLRVLSRKWSDRLVSRTSRPCQRDRLPTKQVSPQRTSERTPQPASLTSVVVKNDTRQQQDFYIAVTVE